VIRGYGSQFTLDETVTQSPNSSTSTWTTSDPDGANPEASGKKAQWYVNTDQLSRYANHALPSTVKASDTSSGIELRGLSAVAGLGYVHTATSFLTAGSTNPVELISITSRLMLAPGRGDASAIQYAGDTTVPIVFPRNADGTFQPYTFCGEVDQTNPLLRGYRVASPSPWVPGTNDTTRKANYEAGDLPMPEGSERLHVRYSFVAVATYGDAPPAGLTLPDCTVNNPPSASFTYTPATLLEGRVVQFEDTSTDPENNISSWRWNFGDGETGTGRTPHHLYKDDGAYSVTLTVTDMSGLADVETRTLIVSNLSPEVEVDDAKAQIVVPATTAPVKIVYRTADAGHVDKQNMTIDIAMTVPGVGPLHYTQAAGNWSLDISAVAAGTYSATVTVTDKDGGSSSDSATITVSTDPVIKEEPPPGATCDPGVGLDGEEQAFLELVNQYRAVNGLAPVVASPTLTRAAERHVHDMALHADVGHIGSDGSNPLTRAQDALYTGTAIGENLARDLETGVAVLFGWRSSTEGHNEGMLDPRWVAVGIAREFDSTTGWSWATTYGNVTDCPELEFVAVATGSPDTYDLLGMNVTLAPAPNEQLSVTVDASVSEGSLVSAGASTLIAPSLDAYGPVPAFVISPANPSAGAVVTFRNRSRDAHGNPIAATIDPGAGASQLVAANGAMAFTYGVSGDFNASASATDAQSRTSTATRPITVGVAPCVDTDGDTLCDALDFDDDNDSNLPAAYTTCKGPCPGGFNRDTIELAVGTNPLDRCADTTAPNDEADDKWPPDFDDNRSVNVIDFTLWKAGYPSPPKPLTPRADLDGSGAVNVLDFTAWKAYFGATCSP